MSNRRKPDRPSRVKPDRTPSPLMLEVRKIVRALGASHEALAAKIKRIENGGGRILLGGMVYIDVEKTNWEISDWRTGEDVEYGDGGLDEYEAAMKRLNEAGSHDIEDLRNECFQQPSETPGIPPSLSDALGQWVASGITPYEEIAAVAEMTVREVTDNVAGFRDLYS